MKLQSKSRLLQALALVLFLAGLLWLWSSPAPVSASVDKAASKLPPPVVFTQAAKRGEIFDQLSYPARVDSKINARILAEADGVVQEIVAPLGSLLRKGAAVLIIRNIDPGFQYAPLRLASPVAGAVSSLKVTVGAHVAKGQELATVTDPAAVKIAIEASALDLPLLRKGMKGEFMVPGRDKPVPVVMAGLSPLLDPVTGTAAAELQIDPSYKEALVLPGQVGQVRFKANERMGFVLPDHAIVYKGEETWLRLVIAGKAKNVAVKLGSKRQGMVEILEGLKDGDQVIERASTFVAEGETVQVQGAAETKTK